MVKSLVKNIFLTAGYRLQKIGGVKGIPDADLYDPLFSPWRGGGNFKRHYQEASRYTIVSDVRCYVLYSLARQALGLKGDWYEAGVYRGGTAMLLAGLLTEKQPSDVKLRLFDTFAGMPKTDSKKDIHIAGDFNDTSLEGVRNRIQSIDKNFRFVEFHPGFVPQSFRGREGDKVSLAHIDVDIYKSILDSCEFIYPRMVSGGFMVFDDYGFPTCPGAREAVDHFFKNRPEVPLVLPTGQAVVFKLS